MQRETLDKRDSEAASQLQGPIVRAFSSNTLVNNHGYDGWYPIYFDSSTIVRLAGLL